MEGKVAVLGDEDFVMPFAALGLDTYAVGETKDDKAARAAEIVKGNYTLVVVAENIARDVEETFEAVSQKATPCVVTVPFTTESEGFAVESLGKVLKMATGIDILANE